MHYIIITVVIIALVAFLLLKNDKPEKTKTLQEEVEESVEQINKLEELEEQQQMQQLVQQQVQQQVPQLVQQVQPQQQVVVPQLVQQVQPQQQVVVPQLVQPQVPQLVQQVPQQIVSQQIAQQQINETNRLVNEINQLYEIEPLDLVTINNNIIKLLTLQYKLKQQNNQLTEQQQGIDITELSQNLNYISYIYSNTDQFLLGQADPNGNLTDEQKLAILNSAEYNQAKNDLILGIKNESIVMWNGIKSELN